MLHAYVQRFDVMRNLEKFSNLAFEAGKGL
jgi:hypothetical protein